MTLHLHTVACESTFVNVMANVNVLIKVSLWTKVKDTEVEDKITEDSRCIEEEVMELSRKKETVLAGVHSTAADKVRFLCLNIPCPVFDLS